MQLMGKQTDYDAIISSIFKKHHKKRCKFFEFDRDEIAETAAALNVPRPKNIGDVIYSFRFRKALPDSIRDTAPKKKEWVIQLAGHGRYRFRLCEESRIVPRPDLITIKIPDATPEIIAKYALNDEQALLAKVRYNRLVDVFLGVTAYSLQNHLRTSVAEIGQIEVDEIYVGVNRQGAQFVIPVQAKGGRDQLGRVQAEQDLACCMEKFPHLVCRLVAAQFMPDDTIAMFELGEQDAQIRVVEERHYQLVPAESISEADLKLYRRNARP
jgi:hypothetical protein